MLELRFGRCRRKDLETRRGRDRHPEKWIGVKDRFREVGEG